MEAAPESNGVHATNGAKVKEDIAGQLEAERQERRRLEGRVVSLNDQLQQLHLQLKANLEAESNYHKRVAECEEGIKKAEESVTAAKVALRTEVEERQRLEKALAGVNAEFARREEEQNLRHKEWLAKLETSLADLQQSDTRLEKEIATRRGIDVKLQMLRQDFCAQVKK